MIQFFICADLNSSVLLIDNFDSGTYFTLQNLKITNYSGGAGSGSLVYNSTITRFNSGRSLSFNYNNISGISCSTLDISIDTNIDYSEKMYFSFHIRGDASSSDDLLALGFKEKDNSTHFVIITNVLKSGINISWQKVIVPFSSLSGEFTNAVSILFMAQGSLSLGNGTVFLEDLTVGDYYAKQPEVTSTYIDAPYINFGSISMDGLLNETIWNDTPALIMQKGGGNANNGFFEQTPPLYATDTNTFTIKFCYDSSYLYVGITSDDKYIESAVGDVNSDGIFGITLTNKDTSAMKKYGIIWTTNQSTASSWNTLYGQTVPRSRDDSILSNDWCWSAPGVLTFNSNNGGDDNGVIYEMRIPFTDLGSVSSGDSVPVNIVLVDHDLNPGLAYDDNTVEWAKYWWGNSFDDTKPLIRFINLLPSSDIPLTQPNTFKNNGNLISQNLFLAWSNNHLSINADSINENPAMEGIRFEYSSDNLNWIAIGVDYSATNNLYQVIWSNVVNPSTHYFLRAVAQNIYGVEQVSTVYQTHPVDAVDVQAYPVDDPADNDGVYHMGQKIYIHAISSGINTNFSGYIKISRGSVQVLSNTLNYDSDKIYYYLWDTVSLVKSSYTLSVYFTYGFTQGSKSISIELTDIINHSGGTVYNADKAYIIIPENALYKNEIQVAIVDQFEGVSVDNFISSHPHGAYFNSGYNFTPEEVTFSKNTLIGLPVNNPQDRFLHIFYWDYEKWIDMGGYTKVKDGQYYIETSVSRLGLYAVFEASLVDKNIANVIITPDIFTPNKDGFNDTLLFNFQSNLDPGKTVSLKILNLNGQLVKDYSIVINDNRGFFEWDGKDEYAQIVPMGVYVFQLKTDQMSYRGIITIVK